MQTQAEPSRPLTLPPQETSWRQTLLGLLGTVIFGAMLGAMGYFTLPNLIDDWRVRDTAVPVNGRVTEGSCSSRLFLHTCDATLLVQGKPRQVTRSVNYVFVDVHSGSYSVQVMADPARPELATTSLAIEKLWNRTITMAVGAAILLALTVAPVIAVIRRLRRRDGA
jgi:hypothetical protein